MITLEYLTEQKEKYQQRAEYFKTLCFDNLADEFQGVINLIGEMEIYIKEKVND